MMTRRNLIIAGLLLAVLLVGVAAFAGFGDDASDPATVGLDAGSESADALPSGTADAIGDPVRYTAAAPDTGAEEASGVDADTDSDVGTDDDDSSDPADNDSPETDGDTPSDETVMADLRVIWWNDTVGTVPNGALVSIGDAAWNPDTGADSARGLLSKVEIGQAVMLVVLPDGPDGVRIMVPLLLTPDMNPASDADAVHVEVSDTSVRVLGNPVDNFDVTFDRF